MASSLGATSGSRHQSTSGDDIELRQVSVSLHDVLTTATATPAADTLAATVHNNGNIHHDDVDAPDLLIHRTSSANNSDVNSREQLQALHHNNSSGAPHFHNFHGSNSSTSNVNPHSNHNNTAKMHSVSGTAKKRVTGGLKDSQARTTLSEEIGTVIRDRKSVV